MNELRVSPVMNPHKTKRHDNFTDVLHTGKKKKKKRSESLLRCFYVGDRKAPKATLFMEAAFLRKAGCSRHPG